MSYRYQVKWIQVIPDDPECIPYVGWSPATYSERYFDIKPWLPDALQSALGFARELLSSGQVCILSKQEWQIDFDDAGYGYFVWTDMYAVELHSPDECTPGVKLEPLYKVIQPAHLP